MWRRPPRLFRLFILAGVLLQSLLIVTGRPGVEPNGTTFDEGDAGTAGRTGEMRDMRAYTYASSTVSSCPPPLAFTASGRSVGRTFKIIYRLFSTSSAAAVANAAVRFGLPTIDGPYKIKYSAFPSKRGVQLVIADAKSAYWLNVVVPPKGKRMFSISVKATLCEAATLRFQLMTYLTKENGTSFCPSGAQEIEIKVQPKYVRGGLHKHHYECVTPRPTPAPGPSDPFELYAEEQRCLEGQLAPFITSRSSGRLLEGTMQQRLLLPNVTIENPTECWAYCSLYGGVPPDFFIHWQTVKKQCFCCGKVCTLVYDPDSEVFIVTSSFNSTASRLRRRLTRTTDLAANADQAKRIRQDADALFERKIFLSTSQIRPLSNTLRRDAVKGHVAVVTFLTGAGVMGYNSMRDYENILPLTLHSLRMYAEKHGYSFHIDRRSSAHRDRQPYWQKIAILREALQHDDVQWVLYTDLDVLVLDHHRRLEDFMVPGRDIISVNEWNTLYPGEGRLVETPRSGFLLVRNTERTRLFLDLWETSFRYYKDIENPEQSALETLFASPAWEPYVYLHDWQEFHSYDTSPVGASAFSMHFPGKFKPYRVARMWMYMKAKGVPAYADELMADYAASLLRSWTANFVAAATQLGYAPQPEDRHEVERCLYTASWAGYGVNTSYDADYHAYVDLYHELGFLHNLPATIFLAVSDKTTIPAKAAASIDSWRRLNPDHQIVVHDDADIEALVRRLVPELQERYQDQQADIYRFVVTAFLGGVYADTSTICTKSIVAWGLRRDLTLAVGVASRNGDVRAHNGSLTTLFASHLFAGSAFHPGLMRTLQHVLDHRPSTLTAYSLRKVPLNKASTIVGAETFTDGLAEYLCYAYSHTSPTPNAYAAGGEAPGLYIFDVAAFESAAHIFTTSLSQDAQEDNFLKSQ